MPQCPFGNQKQILTSLKNIYLNGLCELPKLLARVSLISPINGTLTQGINNRTAQLSRWLGMSPNANIVVINNRLRSQREVDGLHLVDHR
jgi:hypothetical protein